MIYIFTFIFGLLTIMSFICEPEFKGHNEKADTEISNMMIRSIFILCLIFLFL